MQESGDAIDSRLVMNTSTRPLGASSPELALGLLAARACEDLAANASSRSPKTRIGPSAIFGETRTEPLAFLTSTSQRACGDSWPGIAEGLCCFIQEDPIGFAPGPNSYEYANANPINSTDPSGLEPEPVEVFTSEWVTSFKLLFDFVTGTGPGAHQYGPGSSRVQGLKLTPGLDAARKEFRAGGCRPSDPFPIGFGLTGLISSGPNAVRQQVGGFVVTIDPLPNGFAKFTARNTLSAKSFFYHLPFVPASVPRRDDTPVPFSDIKEVFWWVEKLPCCEAK